MGINKSLLLFSALFLSTALLSEAVPVVDTDGDALRPGGRYYILPVIRGMGGGLVPADKNSSCPLYVAQATQEVSDGFPLRINPLDTAATTVDESMNVNIVFTGASICLQSMTWSVANLKYVVLNGSGSVFRIASSGTRGYKLVFCPAVCKTCIIQCADVGVVVDGGRRWLGLGGTSFPVMFKKA